MPVNYILTFDYEMFGSGKGSIQKHLIEPTNKIISLLKKRGVKATFFVEQLEIDAIIALRNRYPEQSQEYKDSLAVEQQVLDLAEQGHDIQLHLHPQWFNARYDNKHWDLNFQWWNFSDLPYRTTEEGIPGKYDLIKAGKQSLESLVRRVKPAYQCVAFRAGGYNIGANSDSVKALCENGLKLDSSVCPGFVCSSGLSCYDFTEAADLTPYWKSKTSLVQESDSATSDGAKGKGCIELPLITTYSFYRNKVSLARISNMIFKRSYKKISYSTELKRIKRRGGIASANSNFDVCLASSSELKKLIAKIKLEVTLSSLPVTPITLIGHPKDYNCFSPLASILKNFSGQKFATVTQLLDDLE